MTAIEEPGTASARHWTDIATLHARLRRLWQRGELLRACVANESTQTLRLPLQPPTAAELGSRFEELRAWIAALKAIPGARIEWRDIQHRALGAQRLPRAIVFDDVLAALALIGKRAEATRFLTLLRETREAIPELDDWMTRYPHRALELADDWPRLLAVVAWLRRRPRPDVYPRQADIPGVHSKFIETHRAVLSELLDRALPPAAIDETRTGVAQFAARYGLRDRPGRVRLRVLDEALNPLPDTIAPDLTLDAANFARLNLPARQVFITENEINFLALPPLPGAIAIFGAGYGWELLAQASWLMGPSLHYWGDIDTHGFAILDQLRVHFPNASSLLMDRATLLAHEAFWGAEPKPVTHDLPRLTAAERELFETLRDNRIRPRLRLEQERIRFDWALTALSRAAQHL